MNELPAGWARVTLGETSTSVRNGIFVSRPGVDPDGVPILRISSVRPGSLNLDEIRYSGRSIADLAAAGLLLEPGDLLFTRYNGNIDFVGACAIVPANAGPLTYPDKLIRVQVDQDLIDSRFAHYALQFPSVRAQIRSLARTTAGQAGISGSSLRSVGIPLPPLAEQRRIVDALEDQLSLVASGLAQLEAVARRANRFRDQVMQIAGHGQWSVDDGSTSAAEEPVDAGVQDGELPRIPAGWTWRRLGEIADVVGGVTKDSKRQSDPEYVEVPYLRVANVQRARLDLRDVATIRVPAKKAEQLRLRPGDVLLNEGGDRDKLGRGWVWKGQIPDCIHQNHVFRARVDPDVLHPKLLAWHANGFGRSWFQANGLQSVNLASISLGKMKLFPVPIPPKEEQARLVAIAEQQLSLLDSVETAIAGARAKAAQLRKSLLAEAFAGRLVPQDPADEPASELLARIRVERAAAAPPQRKARQTAGRSVRTKKELAAPPTRVTGDDYEQGALPL